MSQQWRCECLVRVIGFRGLDNKNNKQEVSRKVLSDNKKCKIKWRVTKVPDHHLDLKHTLESPSLQKPTVDSKMSLLVISLNWLSPNSKVLDNKELLSVVVDLLIKCDTLSMQVAGAMNGKPLAVKEEMFIVLYAILALDTSDQYNYSYVEICVREVHWIWGATLLITCNLGCLTDDISTFGGSNDSNYCPLELGNAW